MKTKNATKTNDDLGKKWPVLAHLDSNGQNAQLLFVIWKLQKKPLMVFLVYHFFMFLACFFAIPAFG